MVIALNIYKSFICNIVSKRGILETVVEMVRDASSPHGLYLYHINFAHV